MSEFGRQLIFVDESNDLVLTTLGFKKILDDLAIGAESPLRDDVDLLQHDDELLVSALLGLLSVRRTLNLWIDPILADSTPDDTEEPTNVDLLAQGLMR